MATSIKYIRNRLQTTSNLIKIHNYSYYNDKPIGSGNFSTVFEAFSHTTHSKIAGKIVKMSSLTFKKLEELLDQQIQILLTLDHINTIKCYDVLKTPQQCYIFTEYCDGGTLEKVLKQRGPLNEQQAWPYIKGIYEGLKYLNSKNIIHRDLKPANIFLKEDIVKIADFGFAVKAKEKFQDMNIGSPFYMAPEAFIANTYGSKTDVWSFGIILYELLHAKTPFWEIQDAESLHSRITVPIKRENFRPEISYELRDLILRCLQIDQSKRISIQEIENSYFMRKRTSGLDHSYYGSKHNIRLLSPRPQINRCGTHTIIRIPTMTSVKGRQEDNVTKENSQPQNKSYYDFLKVKSYSKLYQLNKTACSSLQTNPESPGLAAYRPSVYKTTDSFRVKPEIKQVKTMTYDAYLSRNNKNQAIKIK